MKTMFTGKSKKNSVAESAPEPEKPTSPEAIVDAVAQIRRLKAEADSLLARLKEIRAEVSNAGGSILIIGEQSYYTGLSSAQSFYAEVNYRPKL